MFIISSKNTLYVNFHGAKMDLLNLKNRKLIKFNGSPKAGYYSLTDAVNGKNNPFLHLSDIHEIV